MSSHTPGPWHIRIDDTGGPFTGWPSVEAAEDLDCSIIHRAGFKQEFWGELSQREAVANARLIAAAPDLLEQLQMCAEALKDSGHYPLTLIDALAAIAKAIGGAA